MAVLVHLSNTFIILIMKYPHNNLKEKKYFIFYIITLPTFMKGPLGA